MFLGHSHEASFPLAEVRLFGDNISKLPGYHIRTLSFQCTSAHHIELRNLVLMLGKYFFSPTKENIFLPLCKPCHTSVLESYIMHVAFPQ